jgi:HEAT repeat protein
MILVVLCATGLMAYRVYLERSPVYQLIRQLRTGNAQARSQAASQIGLMGPKAAFAAGALTSALDDPDPGVRTAAVDALINVGSRSPRLLRALVAEFEKSPGPSIPLGLGRMSVRPPGFDPFASLSTIRPPAAEIVPILVEAIAKAPPETPFHRRLIRALCTVADWSDPASPELASALLDHLSDESLAIRKQAAEALAKLDRAAQEKAIARLVVDLRDLGSSRSFEASTLLPLIVDGIPAAVAALADEVQRPDEVRRLTALYLLAQYGELATPAAPTLMQLITERDADRRIHLGLRMYWWKLFGTKGGDDSRRPFPDPSTPGETSAVALGVRALIAIGGAVEQRAIRDLISIVRDSDGDPDRKRCAIVALGEFGPEAVEAIPVLAGAIQPRVESTDHEPSFDPDDGDALSPGALATTALGQIGSEGHPKVETILAGLLEAEDAMIRSRAAMAIGRLGPKATPAVPALLKALESRDRVVRRWSASALGQIGGPEAHAVLPALMVALGDEDHAVRMQAAAAIGPFGAEARAAVPEIVRLLWESGPEPRVIRSLGQIGPDAAVAVPPLVQSLDVASPPTRREIEEALDRIMPRIKGATIAGSIAVLKASGPIARVRAAYELGRLIERRPHSAEGLAALGQALHDPDPLVRQIATAALGRVAPSAAVAGQVLIRAAENPDESGRKLAAEGLGRAAAEVPGAIPALSDLMKDPSGDVRRRAAGALATVGSPAATAIPAMIAALEGQDIPTRTAILTALGKLGTLGESVTPTLLAALDDPSEDVRAAAVDALGAFIGSHRDVAVPALLKALKDPSRTVRFRASQTLGASRPARLILPHLVERLDQGEPIVKVAAAAALSRMAETPEREPETTRRAVETLAAALADPDRRVRSGAAWGLARFGDEAAAVEPALPAAMDDPSRTVRDGASAALRAIAEGRARR